MSPTGAPAVAPPPAPTDAPHETAAAAPPRGAEPAFEVHLDVYSGPFALLLGLITRHRLDITEVALAQVTDEFLSHLRRSQQRPDWDLSETSEFLVVAATLLDLKAARLLPRPEAGAEDPEELARLEARDLLFARLLQHRAYAEVAQVLRAELVDRTGVLPRAVRLEPALAAALPPLELTTTPDQLADLARAAFTRARRAAATTPGAPAPGRAVDLAHLHAPAVSVPDQVARLTELLRAAPGPVGFTALVADAGVVAVVVGRFLALLELYRRGAVDLDQADPHADLVVTWVPGAPS